MAIRGLKALLVNTAPGKLVRTRAYTCYKKINPVTKRPVGPKLRGVARRLGECVFSKYELPIIQAAGSSAAAHAQGKGGKGGKVWRGPDGGLRRGKAVDAQVSRLAKASADARKHSSMLKLTRVCFHALAHHQLEPLGAQRVVLDARRGIATAADVICQRGKDEVVLVELKCGFSGDRALGIPTAGGKLAKMRAPLKAAHDCALHRHLAQLAATHALFQQETGTLKALNARGITKVSGALLYVDDVASELHELPGWWIKRADKILAAI
jgi:hypothetical protein